ncbi:MAG: DUF2065 domain-containing protein [Chromatiales bacterium]|jgi:hypothetical protein|nr:DUF2065 domain-containing protein [Chromatiales bacterium]MDP6151333.1 DUF2065 domain-containing protein [Gammaproteobacteria bacterium]MDP7093776.1 DUF2065 domain-containing protein [Gammaproteobacteria bacterium]MDP7270800.1 DUF2065 domain-containing protein [Gammaproteobacteria bacterium]HJP04849.1 DUF2065 domain-containing protein [Gammaproteobacteria bacterium]
MEWTDLFAAFALYLIIEGLLPFASPRSWKQSIELVAQLSERQLRVCGLVSMLVGAVLLAFVRGR